MTIAPLTCDAPVNEYTIPVMFFMKSVPLHGPAWEKSNVRNIGASALPNWWYSRAVGDAAVRPRDDGGAGQGAEHLRPERGEHDQRDLGIVVDPPECAGRSGAPRTRAAARAGSRR